MTSKVKQREVEINAYLHGDRETDPLAARPIDPAKMTKEVIDLCHYYLCVSDVLDFWMVDEKRSDNNYDEHDALLLPELKKTAARIEEMTGEHRLDVFDAYKKSIGGWQSHYFPEPERSEPSPYPNLKRLMDDLKDA